MKETIISGAAMVSRRRFLGSTALAGAGMWLAPWRAEAEEESIVIAARRGASQVKIKTQTLRGNVSVLLGSGGNIAVLTGPDGKLMVDAGFAGSQTAISEALAQLGPDPVKHLVNTHWHFDHTDGNEWLHAAGAEITAHENTRKRMSASTHVEAWKWTFPPAPEGARPTSVFPAERKLQVNGATVALKYYGPCHTDTDISAQFVEADILHAGDTWWNGIYPFIDYSTGGESTE
jgi:glyoxylase-like metal-dependent hydrolase (beta-lactamase superfamily II)